MTGARCNFCGTTFRNQQAVRAHLKACGAYRQLPKATVPRVGRAPGTRRIRTGTPVNHSTSESVFEEECPRRQPPRAIPSPAHGAVKQALRRLAIQSTKDAVIASWWLSGHTIPAETKAQALAAIERELSGLPADELPRSELVTIAEGIRDRIYRPVIAAQKREGEDAERQRVQARQRPALIAGGVAHGTRVLQQAQNLEGWARLDLQQQVKRALEQELDGSESAGEVRACVDEILAKALRPIQQAAQRKVRERLIAHGLDYATEELAEEEDLAGWERSSLTRDVKRILEAEIVGDESENDVEALADAVLDEMLGEDKEGDGDEPEGLEDEEEDEAAEEDDSSDTT